MKLLNSILPYSTKCPDIFLLAYTFNYFIHDKHTRAIKWCKWFVLCFREHVYVT